MHKRAPYEFPIHDLITERWSPRAFGEKSIEPEIIASLFEAARWAPSSSNLQPWSYLVATKDQPDEFTKMLSVLVPNNAGWAKNAAVLALAVAELNLQKTGSPNRNAQYDTGAATALLCIEATSRGLFVHQMAGFDAAKARELFKIPAGFEPLAAMAIGYPGDPETLPQPLREREMQPRVRKPISQFVMTGEWGHPASFLSQSES